MLIKKTIAAILVASAVSSSPANATGAVAGATEFTQIANNIILGESLVEQIAMVTQETLTATNTLNTYKTFLEDMMALPDDVMGSMLSLFTNDIGLYRNASSILSDAQSSTRELQGLYEMRYQDMLAMEQQGYNPQFYLSREMELARADDVAAKRLYEDMASVAESEQRLGAIAEMGKKAPQIASDIGGFQALAALAAAGATESAELNKTMREQMALDRNNEVLAAKNARFRMEQEKKRIEADKQAYDKLRQPVSKQSDYDLKPRKL